MAVGGKFDYDKYLKGPEDHQNYFHVDPVSGHILLGGKNQPVLKEHPLAKQIMNSISPLDLWHAIQTRRKMHTDTGNIFDTNTAKAPNSQVITTQPNSPTNHGRIDSSPQISVIPITSDPHNVSIESETSSKMLLRKKFLMKQ